MHACVVVVRIATCPGCVWAVAFLDDGDLVTACADGVARVWSCNPSRAADAEVLQVRAADHLPTLYSVS